LEGVTGEKSKRMRKGKIKQEKKNDGENKKVKRLKTCFRFKLVVTLSNSGMEKNTIGNRVHDF